MIIGTVTAPVAAPLADALATTSKVSGPACGAASSSASAAIGTLAEKTVTVAPRLKAGAYEGGASAAMRFRQPPDRRRACRIRIGAASAGCVSFGGMTGSFACTVAIALALSPAGQAPPVSSPSVPRSCRRLVCSGAHEDPNYFSLYHTVMTRV